MGNHTPEFAGRHPVTILFYMLACVVWTMLTRHPASIVLAFAASAVTSVVLCGVRQWRGLLIPAACMLLFSVFVLPFFSHRGVTPLFYVNGMAVTAEAVVYGVCMTVMLWSVLQWCLVAGRLFDSEKLLYLLGKVMPSLGLMLMMIFRAVPDMRARYRQIHEAQLGLGRTGAGASLRMRMRCLLRELSVLISWSLEDSVEVSISMESRGYQTGRRTWFHLFSFRAADAVWLFGMLCGFAGIYAAQWTGGFRAYYFPEIAWQPLKGTEILAMAAGFAVMTAPVWCELAAHMRVFSGKSVLQDDGKGSDMRMNIQGNDRRQSI